MVWKKFDISELIIFKNERNECSTKINVIGITEKREKRKKFHEFHFLH